MHFKAIVSALATCLFLLPVAANADVLYSNGAPDGVGNGYLLNQGGIVSDSFTLSQASTITGVDFVADASGASYDTVDFGIDSTAEDYTLGTTAALTAGADDAYSFSVANLVLGPGTYYLVLGNAHANAGHTITGDFFWSESGGKSAATSNINGEIPSESFDIIGTVNAVTVPEAPGWTLMLAGVASLAGFAAMRRRAASTAA